MLKKRIEVLEKRVKPEKESMYLRFVSPTEDSTGEFGFGWFFSGKEWHTSEEGESEQDFMARLNIEGHEVIDGDKAVQEVMEKDDC